MKVLILYFSKTGHTLEAANAIVEGIEAAGSEAEIVNVKEFDVSSISNYEAIIVGSPCWAGSMSKKKGVSKPVKKMLNAIEPGVLAGKKCGAFAVHSGNGGGNTVANIGSILKEKGCADCKIGPVATAGSPASLWKGKPVGPEDQEILKNFGSEFVQ